MAYNPDTKILSVDYPTAGTGISLGDIASALGGGDYDLGTLCSSANVRKFNKHKPVNRNTTDILTDDQYKGVASAAGVPSDRNVNWGWYYGLKLATYQDTDWADIHNVVTYEYDRPTGGIGISPYRALDFDGYQGNLGNPCDAALEQGTLIGISDIENGLSVHIAHTGNAATEPSTNRGVDAAWCCSTSKASVHPVCVMTRNGVSYACALRLDSDNMSRSLFYNSARRDFYHISFEGLPSDFLVNYADYKLSIGFVVRSTAAGALNVYNGAAPQWQEVPSTGFTQRFYGLASGMNRTIQLQPNDATPTPILGTASVTSGTNILVCGYTLQAPVPSDLSPYRIRIAATVYGDSAKTALFGNAFGAPVTMTGHGSIVINPSVDLTDIISPFLVTAETVYADYILQTGTYNTVTGVFTPKKQSENGSISFTYNP